MENLLRLTTITRLLTVVTTLALCEQAGLARLVLRDLVCDLLVAKSKLFVPLSGRLHKRLAAVN